MEAPIDFPPTYKYIRGTNYYTGEIEEETTSESDNGIETAHSMSDMSKEVVSFPVDSDIVSADSVTSTEETDKREAMASRHKSARMPTPENSAK